MAADYVRGRTTTGRESSLEAVCRQSSFYKLSSETGQGTLRPVRRPVRALWGDRQSLHRFVQHEPTVLIATVMQKFNSDGADPAWSSHQRDMGLSEAEPQKRAFVITKPTLLRSCRLIGSSVRRGSELRRSLETAPSSSAEYSQAGDSDAVLRQESGAMSWKNG